MQSTSLFSIPVWQSKMPFFNEDNKKKILNILEEYKKENPIAELKSGLNSYQSPTNLHFIEGLSEIFEYLYHVCDNAFLDLNLDKKKYQMILTKSWFNSNNLKESVNTYHTHNGLFSGVIFLNCPSGSGNLCLFNSGMNTLWIGNQISSNKNQYTSEKVKLESEEGDIFVWPSYLPHCVESNTHDGNRISISFECNIFPRENQNVQSED